MKRVVDYLKLADTNSTLIIFAAPPVVQGILIVLPPLYLKNIWSLMIEMGKRNPGLNMTEKPIFFEDLLKKQEKLHLDLMCFLNKSSSLGQILQHPLVYGVPYLEQMNAVYNQQYKTKKQELKKAKEKKDWNQYIFWHERPYRFHAFNKIKRHLSDEEYWEVLSSVYQDSENLWQVNNLKQLLESKKKFRNKFMDEREIKFLQNLPETIFIHRGHQTLNENGFSWTLSYHKANWFAHRFHKYGEVISGFCKKEEIIGVLLGRNEFEIVVNSQKIEKSKLEIKEKPQWFQALKLKIIGQFALGNQSLHGPWHWEKVEHNATMLQDESSDLLVCQLFALLHDCQRKNENDDPEHGKRAAQFIDTLDLPITKDQLKILKFSCEFHNDGKTSDDATIACCYDSDRLDLIRVGTVPEKKYLSTKRAKDLIFKL